MRTSSNFVRSLALGGLTLAALMTCAISVHAQARGGGTSGGGSSIGGNSGGGSSLGSSNGFGNNSSNGQFSSQSFVGNSGSTGSFVGTSGSSGSFVGTSGSSGGSSGNYGGSSSGGYSIGGSISNLNPFASSYGSPTAAGIAMGTNGGSGTGGFAGTSGSSGGSTVAFGQPMFSQLYTQPSTIQSSGGLSGGSGGSRGGMGGTANMRGGTSGGLSGGLGGSSAMNSSTTGGSPYGVFILPNPVANSPPLPGGSFVGAPRPPGTLAPLAPGVQNDLRDLLGQSDRISATTRSGVTFGLDGDTLVLRGAAASAGDAQALEGLLRFAPGVYGIRNEMTVR